MAMAQNALTLSGLAWLLHLRCHFKATSSWPVLSKWGSFESMKTASKLHLHGPTRVFPHPGTSPPRAWKRCFELSPRSSLRCWKWDRRRDSLEMELSSPASTVMLPRKGMGHGELSISFPSSLWLGKLMVWRGSNPQTAISKHQLRVPENRNLAKFKNHDLLKDPYCPKITIQCCPPLGDFRRAK